MNYNNKTETMEAKCCVDFYTTNFESPDGEVVNNYKCNHKKFPSSDMWNIQKRRREFTRRSSNFVIN